MNGKIMNKVLKTIQYFCCCCCKKKKKIQMIDLEENLTSKSMNYESSSGQLLIIDV